MATRDYYKDLDECMPAAKNALLGTTLRQLITGFNQMQAVMQGASGVLEPSGLARGTPDTQIATGAFNYSINGVMANKAAANNAIGAQTVTADRWALYRLTVASGGTITVSPAAGNAAGYTSEALAKAALPALPANQADLGYVTVKTKAGTAWVAATDGLAGGSTGNVASVTNYYPATPAIPASPITDLNSLP